MGRCSLVCRTMCCLQSVGRRERCGTVLTGLQNGVLSSKRSLKCSLQICVLTVRTSCVFTTSVFDRHSHNQCPPCRPLLLLRRRRRRPLQPPHRREPIRSRCRRPCRRMPRQMTPRGGSWCLRVRRGAFTRSPFAASPPSSRSASERHTGSCASVDAHFMHSSPTAATSNACCRLFFTCRLPQAT